MTVVLWKWTERGFFSEFNSMLLAKSYSDLLKFRFILAAHPSTAMQNGWVKNFVPFCETLEHRYVEKLSSLDEAPGKQLRDSIIMSRALAERALIPSVVFANTLTPIYESMLHSKSVDPLQYLNQCFNSIWKVNIELSEQIKQEISNLFGNSETKPYHGIHVRRGDKNDFEAVNVPIERYIEKLDFSRTRKIYVATDEYSSVAQVQEHLKRLGESGVTLYSLCPKDAHGYRQSEFSMLSDSQKQLNIRLLLTEFEILRHSDAFVGSFTSNVGRTVHIARAGRASFSTDIDFSLSFDPYAKYRRSNWFARLLASILA